ncbi:CC0125/CC1285 family lipoprotein [Pelagicoccus albus]|uniref:Lipoprotein n=1 Tax=Pelagicoccus albus TaxID=415222 RepID=A0A7X1B7B5_9BACT|nr:hypothetical protein [Pelagicoccus albus]MBC2605745.1 hypothetical protein [Pelagicoccus albus]
MKLLHIIAIASATLLSSCETVSYYSPISPEQPFGYSHVDLGGGFYRVTYRGERNSSGRKAFDLARLKAAEIALENGFTHFEIKDLSNLTTYTTTNIEDDALFSAGRPAAIQNSGPSGTTYSQTPWVESEDSVTTKTPYMEIVVECTNYEGSPKKSVQDAIVVKEKLKKKYWIKDKEI